MGRCWMGLKGQGKNESCQRESHDVYDMCNAMRS
jgi:hypothetical protein